MSHRMSPEELVEAKRGGPRAMGDGKTVHAAPLAKVAAQVEKAGKTLKSLAAKHPEYTAGWWGAGLAVFYRGRPISGMPLDPESATRQIMYDVNQRRKHPDWHAKFDYPED